jgi:hypothetical protein
MLEALLNAFTDPTASLSDQIYNLSIYAHMSFVLFRTFRLKFMSNQLYGHSQTMIKNIVFTVAKQQELDPEGKVNAYYDGTDPVENHFGYTRELGGHNSALNFKQGVERSGWACDIHGVHQRNLGLHAGHRRHNITRKEIKDHLNEHNFTGDYIVSHCDLGASWRNGRVRTMEIFKQFSRLDAGVYDIPAILKSTPGLDFMRPYAANIYPGILEGGDRSLPAAASTPVNTETSAPSTDIPWALSPTASPQKFAAPTSTQAVSPEDPDSVEDMMPDPSIPIISFEEALQTEESEPAVLKLEPRSGVRPEDYLIDEKGKFIHKASICRLILNKEFVAKSKNRGERAMGLALKKGRTFTKPNGTRLLNGSVTGTSFLTGDPFAALIRTTTNVSVALVRSTDIFVDGKRVPEINVNSIKNAKANVKLTGQILKLKAVAASPGDTAEESGETADEAAMWTWLWLGSYLMGKSTMKTTQIATDAPHIVSIGGHLVEPLNLKAVAAHERLSGDDMQHINSTGMTWALDHILFRALIDELWKRVEQAQTGLRELPLLKDSLVGFPYCWATGG